MRPVQRSPMDGAEEEHAMNRRADTTSTDAAAQVDVGRVLDEGNWSAYQKWLIFLTALTIVFDGIDNQLLGVVIPAIMRDWSLPRSAFAPVVSIGYAGMMLGGALAGMAGDRVGRRTALLGSTVLFGVMTALGAAASSPAQLAVVRLLAGAGLGGAIPNGAALAAEYVPRRYRPVAVTLTIVCVPLGATIAGLLGIRALPLIGLAHALCRGGRDAAADGALLVARAPGVAPISRTSSAALDRADADARAHGPRDSERRHVQRFA